MNEKSLIIDADSASLLASTTNQTATILTLTRGNTYILQANCYSNSACTTASAFDANDTWCLYIGATYGSNAAPVVTVSNAANWNNVADWSLTNVAAGLICVKANVDGSALTSDIANVSSKSYDMQIVLTNNAGGKVMVCDNSIWINNAVQI